jgi:hypothetical protein
MTQQKKNWQEDYVAFADRMQENGWYGVELTRYTDNYHAVDVREWVHENCTGEYNSFGRHWVFEQSADAVLFKLRWA